MKCTVAEIERFAMAVSDADGKMHVVEGGVDIYAVGAALNMTREATQDCAEAMQLEEWAVVTYTGESPRLVLTLKGRREIAKLRRPKIIRWAEEHPKTVTVLTGLVTVVVTSLVAELLKRLLWH